MAAVKILAIDDEIYCRTLYNDLLSQEGYLVQLAESGEVALKVLAKGKFDLIIVDHPMEGIDGIQLLERVKEQDPFLPVLIAGPSDLQEATFALRKGAADYIGKPLKPKELKPLIRSALDRSRRLREKARAMSGNLEQLRILEIIRKTKDILLTMPGERVLQSLLDLAMDETGASKGGFLWRERDSSDFILQAQKDLFPSSAPAPSINSGEGIIGAILSKVSPAILEPIMKEEYGTTYLGKISTLILPLEKRGETIGGLILADKTSGEPFTQRDIQSLIPITSLIPLLLAPGKGGRPKVEERKMILLGDRLDQGTFEALIEKEVKKSQRYRRSFSLLLINIDQLRSLLEKSVPLGPEEILQQLHGCLLETIRGADIVALMDNGEIGLLVPETNYQGAIAAARRIRNAFHSLQIVRAMSLPSRSPIGFGVACFPEHGLTKDELLERARQAMERAAESASRFEDLWGYFDKLLAEARITSELIGALSWTRERKDEELAFTPRDSDQLLPTGEFSRELQFVGSWEDFQTFNQYIEDKIFEKLAGEGIYYIGLKKVSSLEPRLERYYRMLENGIEIFVFAKEDWEGWDPRDITPVVTEDPALADYSFSIYYGVSACYALVGRQRDEEGMCGFFSISDLLVNEIIRKLNETYL